MNIVAPIQFQKIFFSEHRLVFDLAPEENFIQNEKPDEEPDSVRLAGRLAESAFEEYLDKHPELKEIFPVEKWNPENSLRASAIKQLREKAMEYMNTARENGEKFPSDSTNEKLETNAETVCNVLVFRKKISELEDENAKLKVQSRTDCLTELPNRRAFLEHLEDGIEQYDPLHLLIIDLDQFKQVNDKYGHQAGDKILKQLADCIQDMVREEDAVFVGRYGSGDEFVMLASATEEDACKIAVRVSKAIKETPFTIGNNGTAKTIRLTASIGISTFEGKENDPDGEKMLKKTDDCLYILKGTKPDINNVQQERRGGIACNGEVIGKNPSFSFNKDIPHITRSNVSKIVTGVS